MVKTNFFREHAGIARLRDDPEDLECWLFCDSVHALAGMFKIEQRENGA
jgi:hypothetical protein